MKSEQPESPDMLSRRETLIACGAALILPTACKTTPLTVASVDEQIARIGRDLIMVARRNPDLPGVRSLARLESSAASMSAGDEAMLNAALHIQLRERLTRHRRTFGLEQIRTTLSRPIDVSRFGDAWALDELATAKRRAETEPGYGAALNRIINNPSHMHCEKLLTGETVPCWLLRRQVVVAVYDFMGELH